MTDCHPVFGTSIPRGWAAFTVDDIKAAEPSSCVAGPFGSNISAKYFSPAGVPVIRGGNLTDDLRPFVAEGFVFVTPDRAQQYKAQHVRAGDLVFTCWGTIGQVGLIPADGPYPEYIISNKQLKLRPNPTSADSRFLFYYFASPPMVEHIRNHAVGAAVPGINLGILKRLPVILPPLPIQRKISSVLGAYDALIENNNRRIRILEEMVQRIYREWFVDFRYPGHANVPIVESALGPIPEGWEWRELRDLAAESRIGVDPSAVDPDTPYIGLEHMPERSVAISEWGTARDAGSRKFEFAAGQILFGKIRPYFHKVVVPPVAGICSTDAIVIQSRAPEHASLVLAVVSSDAFIEQAVQTSQGTKMPRANWSVLERYSVAVAPPDLTDRFNLLVGETIALIHRLVTTNRRLRASRDLLLPRLISGEIDVEGLDIAVPDMAA